MSLKVGELAGILDLDDKPFNDKIDRAGGPSGMAKLGTAAVAIGATIGAGLAAGAYKAVMAASDLNETLSKVGVVFGEEAKKVSGFADDMADKFGLNKRVMMDAAASIGLVGKASGLGQAEAAKMSTELARMAADASSFYNVPLEEALAAIQSGLVGEAEPMRRFGVLLNEAAVQAEATRMGLGKVNGEFSEGAKAQARASLIMSGMTDASGDLERTQDSLANRMKEVRGRAENFAMSLGGVLLPVVLKGFDLFEALSGSLKERLGPALEAVKSAAGRAGEVLGPFFATLTSGMTEDDAAAPLEKVALAIRKIVDAARWLASLFSDAASGMDMWTEGATPAEAAAMRLGSAVHALVEFVRDNAMPVFAGIAAAIASFVVPAFIAWTAAAIAAAAAQLAAIAPIVAVAAAIAALVGGVIWAYKHFEAFRSVVDDVAGFCLDTAVPAVQRLAGEIVEQLGNAVGWVVEMWPQISEAIGHVMVAIQEVTERVLAVVGMVWRNVGDDILNIAERVFHAIYGVVNGVLDAMRGLIQAVLAAINGDWGKAWQGILDFFRGIWDAIYAALAGVVGGVVSIFAGLGGTILGALGNVGGLLVDAGKSIVGGLIDGIKSMGGALVNALFDTLGPLEGVARKLFDSNSPSRRFALVGASIPDGMIVGMSSRTPELNRSFRQMMSGLEGAPTRPSGFGAPQAGAALTGASSPALIHIDKLEVNGTRDPDYSAVATTRELRNLAFLGGGLQR